MELDPPAFLGVPVNTNDPHPLTPAAPGPPWRGLVIDAPRTVRFRRGERFGAQGAFAVVPVCGWSLLDAPPAPTSERVRLVAEDVATGDRYEGALYDVDASPERPPPDDAPPDPALLRGVAVGSAFNPNLLDFVALPAVPATYRVHAEFRGFASNVVTITFEQR